MNQLLNNLESVVLFINVVLIVFSVISLFKFMTNYMIWLNARIHDSTLFQARIQESVAYVPEAVIQTLTVQVKAGEKAAINACIWASISFGLLMVGVAF